MRVFVWNLAAVVTIAALAAGAARAHGVPAMIDVVNGQLTSLLEVNYDHHEGQMNPFPAATPVAVRGTAAFHPVFGGGVPTGTVMNVDVAGNEMHPAAMLYWDGADVLPSPYTANVTRTGVNINVAPADTFVAGGALSAYNGLEGGHSSVNVALPLDAAVGLYAIGFQLTAPGIDRSETFWAVLNNGMSEADAARGTAAIRSAVPEPGTWALLATGGAAAAVCGAVRRRRSRG